MKSEKERMLAGKPYVASGKELESERRQARKLLTEEDRKYYYKNLSFDES